MDSNRILTIILLVVIGFWILTTLSNLLIPFVLALFMVMVLQPILAFLNEKHFPNWLSVTIVSIITLLLLFSFVTIIYSTATQVADQGKEFVLRLTEKATMALDWFNNLVGSKLNLEYFERLITENMSAEWITRSLGSIAKSLGSFIGSFILFSFYFIILLTGFNHYEKYILYVGGEKNGRAFLKTFEDVMHSISTYMGVKFVVSFLTGLLFWLICVIFGIEFALFWGFLGFALNFIPSIGSIIATIPPILMGLIYLDSGFQILLFAALLISIQMLVGNFLDPILTGNKLKLNILTVMLGLLFWGYIWGIVGMLLSVPLLVLMKIILEQNPETIMIARAMGSSKPAKRKLIAKKA